MQQLINQPGVVFSLLCGLTFLAALAGGALPNLLRLTHARLQIAVSFVAGLMLGLSLLGLLPHSGIILGSVQKAAGWLVAGFLVMFLLQRFLPFHHHDVPEGNPVEPCGHLHSLAERSARSLSWAGVAVGLSLHSVFDGLAIAAAVTSDAHGHGGGFLGLGTALAVILHKPFGALAITTLMAADRIAVAWRHRVNILFALVTPLAAMLFYLGAAPVVQESAGLGSALAFCAGTFLCIACADLLPELQFHAHDRLLLSLALGTGLAVAALIVGLGHRTHAHDLEEGEASIHWIPWPTCVIRDGCDIARWLPQRGDAPG